MGRHLSNEIQFLQSYASIERQFNALLSQYVNLMILELQVSHEILWVPCMQLKVAFAILSLPELSLVHIVLLDEM